MDGSVGGKRTAGEMSEDHDRCFSMLVLVVVSARTKKVIIIWYSGHFLTNKVPLAFKDPKRLHVLVE
jgi:hypothetical protein